MARILAVRSFAFALTAASFVACGTTKITQPTGLDQPAAVTASASISGQVQDNGGAAVSGAVVRIWNGTSAIEAVSDDNGDFAFGKVTDGAWTLTCTKDGFAPASQPLQLDSDMKLVIALSPGDDSIRPVPVPQPLPIKRIR